MERRWAMAGWVLAVAAWINIAAVAIAYLLYPGYVDHGESAISAMAWRILAGAPAYLPLESADRITNLYGPVTYLWHMWPLAVFGGSVMASKAAATISAVLLTPVLALLARRGGPAMGWAVLALSVAYTINLAFPVVIRPDALLTLVAAAGVTAVAMAGERHGRAAVIIGIAAGLALNIKIHALVYLAPVGVYHLWGRWRLLPVMAVAAGVTAALPFLTPSFPLADYLSWFGPMAAKENLWLAGWYWELVLYLLPLVLLALGRDRRLAVAEWVYLGAYGLCVALTVFPATKVGAGSHYFLPFLPTAADLLRRLAAGGLNRRQKTALTLAAVLPWTAVLQSERRFFRKLEWAKSQAVVAEIGAILDAHAGQRVQMTVGRTPEDTTAPFSYHFYGWRNLPVYRGNPYTLDAGIMMELTKLHIPFPAEAIRRVRTCHTQVWLLPKGGDPFNMVGYYSQQVFPDEARAAFKAHNRLAESHQFYDVWVCQPPG